MKAQDIYQHLIGLFGDKIKSVCLSDDYQYIPDTEQTYNVLVFYTGKDGETTNSSGRGLTIEQAIVHVKEDIAKFIQ